MKIPTILKGDDSGAITITLPDGRDFTGATLVLAYGGVTRSFTDLVPGATLSFGFTHDETAGFKLGCKPVLMRLIGPSGAVETVENAAMKIKVTDCLGEVNAGGSFAISPRDLSTSVPVTDLGDLSTTAKIGDLYDKVNEIVRVLAQRSLLVLTLCLGLAAGADVQTARLEDLDRSSVVVTNVTGSSGVDTNAVREIALWPATNYTDRAVADKRDKTDLAVYEDVYGEWEFSDGVERTLYKVWFEDRYWWNDRDPNWPSAPGVSPPPDTWYGDSWSDEITQLTLEWYTYDEPKDNIIATRRKTHEPTSDTLALTSSLTAKRDLTNNTCVTTTLSLFHWTSNDPRCTDELLAELNTIQPVYGGYGNWIGFSLRDGRVSDEPSSDENALVVDFIFYEDDSFETESFRATAKRSIIAVSDETFVTQSYVDDIGAATLEKVEEAKTAANEANAWSSATYAFMTAGRTNCWWSGTNYVFGADAATRRKFAWEPGMDAATVPCSMALYEIREGVRECVWDQRDWTAWYWSFKAQQMETAIQGRIDALGNAVTNDAMYAWAKHYASDGVRNPDPSTTYIDTSTVTLSPGMRWETVATVSGASYWTIVGDGAVIGGSGTNATLQIRDFEGNEIMTVTKGEHRLAWLEHGEIVGNMTDAQGRVCFDMLADAQPVGYFSATLDSNDFAVETSDDCPANYEWEDLGNGKWRIHFILKPGIYAQACFAKFMVETAGQTVIRYNAGQEIQGGLIYNGVKIAPDISGSPAVGTVIQWKVVR